MAFNQVDTTTIKQQLATLKNESAGSKGKGKGTETKWFRMPKEQSKTKIRILPPVGKMARHGKRVWTHFQIPSQEVRQIKCFQTYGMQCPLCDLLDKYRDKFETKNWEPALQTYFNVLVREQYIADRAGNMTPLAVEKPNEPRCLSFSGDYNLIWLLKEIDEGGDITNPVQGYDVIFEREKYGGKFDRRITRESTPIADTEEGINAIAEMAYDLEGDTFRPPSEEYVKRMQQVCAAVRKTVEEKLMPLQAAHQAAPVQQQQTAPMAPMAQQPMQQTAERQLTQAPAPMTQQQMQPTAPPLGMPAPQGFNDTGVAPPNVKNALDAPSGAPVCFGDATVYNPESSQKCLICHVEIDCHRAQKAEKTGHADEGITTQIERH